MDYKAAFREAVEQVRGEGRYRVFADLKRHRGAFPYATWTPPAFNRDGTIVKPAEPSTQDDRPRYETAPWANGASGGSQLAPPGTF